MLRKNMIVFILVFCLGLILGGCPKKAVVKEEPSAQAAAAAEREKAARLEGERVEKERTEQEARRKESERIKEEEARRAQAQKEKEFEKSLVVKKEPGIEGVAFDSKLLKDIHFEFDKYDVRPSDAEILKENAAILMKYPNVKIQVEGHCDERGTIEYNLALGERRASSTKKYLISLGISEGRISSISYGEEKPLDPGHTEDAWAKNRRAHTIILSK